MHVFSAHRKKFQTHLKGEKMKTISDWQGAKIKVGTSPRTFKKHGFTKLRAGQKVLAPCGNFCTIDGVERSWNSICLWYTIDGEKWATKFAAPREEDFALVGEKKIIMSIYRDPIEVYTSDIIFKKLGFNLLRAGKRFKWGYPYDCLCIIEDIRINPNGEKVLWVLLDDKKGALNCHFPVDENDFTPI